MTTGTMTIESFRDHNFLTTEQHETHPSSPSCLSTTRSTLRRVVMLNSILTEDSSILAKKLLKVGNFLPALLLFKPVYLCST
ncbi:unnamed protein product [Dicrocoelium dendriticum]|nr:unnamed protein product [Dicrocoelium dendriticum]